ncbi:MAG: hypothetical protein OXF56_10340 [Rhodobacteraceae bacterium]|nr:hypothetical protein [Paracoccaceae bacterium]
MVAVEAQNPGAAASQFDGVHAIGRSWPSEYIANCAGVEQALTSVAREHRQAAGAISGKKADFAFLNPSGAMEDAPSHPTTRPDFRMCQT